MNQPSPRQRPGLRPAGRRTLRPCHPGRPRRDDGYKSSWKSCPQHGCSISWQACPAMTQPSAGSESRRCRPDI